MEILEIVLMLGKKEKLSNIELQTYNEGLIILKRRFRFFRKILARGVDELTNPDIETDFDIKNYRSDN